MKNVEMKVEKGILTIKVDLAKRFGPSASRKSEIIASTEGSATIPGHDSRVRVGLNVYEILGGKGGAA